ncbi:MAG: hypothetical protein J5747_01295 [Spirochaetaceae bacterium]|nr:hypothetical protein [Spirochaetaceae bacterium]
MTVFISYSLMLMLTTLVGVLVLRYYTLAFIYDTLSNMWSGSFTALLGISFLLLAIGLIIANRILKPFDSIVKATKTDGYVPNNQDCKKCLSCYKKLIILTIVENAVGFFIGQTFGTVISILAGRHQFIPVQVTLITLQAIGFGMLSAIITINGLDSQFAKFRQVLRIHSLEKYKKQKWLNVSSSIGVTFTICAFFIAITMLSVMYGSFTAADKTRFLIRGIACAVLSCALAAIPFRTVLRNLSFRIKSTEKALSSISEQGDLSGRIDITMIDDFGDLTTSINDLIRKLSNMIKELKEKTDYAGKSAEVISDSASTAATAVQQMTSMINKIDENSSNQNKLIRKADTSVRTLAESVETIKGHIAEQVESVKNISTSITEMSSNINAVALTAKNAQDTSQQLSATSEEGKQALEKATAAMNEIHEASHEVQAIIKVIQKIAGQTNLLAMNAAIEAAHAGEFGAGFAVVADEVRSLAQSSASSAKEIQQHIKDMAAKINLGVEAITSAGVSFNGITEKVEKNAQLVSTISMAMEEQSSSAENTQHSTELVVDAVQAIQELTNKENIVAEDMRNFMNSVVEASESTLNAILQGLQATTNLKESIAKVDESAAENKESVDVINQQIQRFKL